MKVIIIASGKGLGLRPFTADRPSCMVEIQGRTVIQHQLQLFAEQGIVDVTVVGGYRYRSIDAQGARLRVDRDFEHNSDLRSFFAAGPELVGDLVVCTGNMLFSPQILSSLLATTSAGCMVVDRQWQSLRQHRADPLPDVSEIELCEVAESGFVRHVGSAVTRQRATGQFIGLTRLNAPLMARLWSIYMAALARGFRVPFGDSENLETARFSDLLNEAFRAGELFNVVVVDGGWQPLETVEDLTKARERPFWKVEERNR